MPPESTLPWLTTVPVSQELKISEKLHSDHLDFEWRLCYSRKGYIFAIFLLEDSGPELYYIREPTNEVEQNSKPRVISLSSSEQRLILVHARSGRAYRCHVSAKPLEPTSLRRKINKQGSGTWGTRYDGVRLSFGMSGVLPEGW